MIEPAGPAVSRAGDLWRLGEHRLVCADARDGAAYERLLMGETAQMTFTDPPYNVRIDGNVGGTGKNRRREFVMAAGEMTRTSSPSF